ncbi:MAG: C40 family peptidase [Desulfovibrio sp.]|nr:C40 family peptidase [Desulfovibrio sp.]
MAIPKRPLNLWIATKKNASTQTPLEHPLFAKYLALFLTLFLCSCASRHTEPPTPTELAIAQTALEAIGTPYCVGGSSPSCFDCSGLVRFCYAKYGIQLPRQAKDQADVGFTIDPRDIHEGDILVFSPGWFSHHTGIAISKTAFVHAPGKGRVVKQESLLAPHWQKMFSEARRIIEAPKP